MVEKVSFSFSSDMSGYLVCGLKIQDSGRKLQGGWIYVKETSAWKVFQKFRWLICADRPFNTIFNLIWHCFLHAQDHFRWSLSLLEFSLSTRGKKLSPAVDINSRLKEKINESHYGQFITQSRSNTYKISSSTDLQVVRVARGTCPSYGMILAILVTRHKIMFVLCRSMNSSIRYRWGYLMALTINWFSYKEKNVRSHYSPERLQIIISRACSVTQANVQKLAISVIRIFSATNSKPVLLVTQRYINFDIFLWAN